MILHSMPGRPRTHRTRWIAALVVGLTLTTAGCSIGTEAGSAFVLDGRSVSDESVQHDASAFSQENVKTTVSSAETASFNRAQITWAVRHDLIAKALAAKNMVVTDAEAAAATAQATTTANLASQVGLPAAERSDVIHDIVALNKLITALPAAGVPVSNVSVTAEGVPATTRDQAVQLRSDFIAHPAKMDAAVSAAGQAGQQAIAKNVYTLLQQPAAGAVGIYAAGVGTVVIFPNSSGYVVLRTTGRTVTSANLTASAFSSITDLSQVFDLAALLLAPYQEGAGISVNPRYGVWDPATLQVVPTNDGL